MNLITMYNIFNRPINCDFFDWVLNFILIGFVLLFLLCFIIVYSLLVFVKCLYWCLCFILRLRIAAHNCLFCYEGRFKVLIFYPFQVLLFVDVKSDKVRRMQETMQKLYSKSTEFVFRSRASVAYCEANIKCPGVQACPKYSVLKNNELGLKDYKSWYNPTTGASESTPKPCTGDEYWNSQIREGDSAIRWCNNRNKWSLEELTAILNYNLWWVVKVRIVNVIVLRISSFGISTIKAAFDKELPRYGCKGKEMEIKIQGLWVGVPSVESPVDPVLNESDKGRVLKNWVDYLQGRVMYTGNSQPEKLSLLYDSDTKSKKIIVSIIGSDEQE